MLKALSDNQITQPVTFPVRASLTAHSMDVMLRLLGETTNSTLTLWGPATDVVDVPALKQVVEAVGRTRVYMDLPEKLKDELTNGTSRGISGGSMLGALVSVVASVFTKLRY